jgi:hypothetical protein
MTLIRNKCLSEVILAPSRVTMINGWAAGEQREIAA